VATAAPLLAAAERLEFAAALSSAIRDTGAMRDRDVLPSALAALPVRPGTEEARVALETALVVDRARRRRPLQRVRRLAVAAARIGLLPARFAQALSADVDGLALARGIERLARRARRAVRAALRRPDDVRVAHSARKRVRLLAAAVAELFGGAGRTARRGRRLASLSSEIGETLDLERLSDFARAPGRALPGRARRRLLAQVRRRLAGRRPKLLRRALRMLKRRRWKARRLRPAKTAS